MCGFCGFIEPQHARTTDDLAATAGAMAARIQHRGPDGAGTWVDAEVGIALGHRRLAIIDLTEHGHQPMVSATGRWVIAFNGEIYNFEELRAELEARRDAPAHRWRGHSDTEVMLAVIESCGVTAALERFNGMFAFALWDRLERTLTLARDRAGEKPLYYGWHHGVFLFGSEIKALAAHPRWQPRHDRGAFALFMRLGYIPAPYSVFQGIAKLPAGALLTLRSADIEAHRMPEPSAYWSAAGVMATALAEPFTGTDTDAVNALDTLLRDAVALRMVADVPLGAFLSGGIDSSTVVAMMQAQGARPVQTFSIGFSEAAFNEAPQARAVAAHLGTQHTELYVSPAEAQAVIPRLPAMYDEPFADPSQIPTHLVSALARQHVTVALSGDGGDELLGGYQRYVTARDVWPALERTPAVVRRGIAGVMHGVSEDTWDGLLGALNGVLPASLKRHDAGRFLHRVADVIGAETPAAFYLGLVSQETDPATLVGAAEPPIWASSPERWPAIPDFAEQMMFLDFVGYLPDDILVKVDRASMAVSLEGRMPILDHRVIELAWRFAPTLKMRGASLKWVLRAVLDRYVPRPLVERPKMGFSVPIDQWLRGPLREWGESLLSERALHEAGVLDVARTRSKWAAHQAHRENNQYWLWNALMLQSWLAGSAAA